MAVAADRISEGSFGPIEPITLIVLREELGKLQGTLTDDILMNYEKCVSLTDEFIDELGRCINLSVLKYPEDQDVYDRVFDGLQDIIDLIHGAKPDLLDSNGHPRLMDPQESRAAASDRLQEITEDMAQEISRREMTKETARMESVRAEAMKKSKPRESSP